MANHRRIAALAAAAVPLPAPATRQRRNVTPAVPAPAADPPVVEAAPALVAPAVGLPVSDGEPLLSPGGVCPCRRRRKGM